jgi:hypothetical protein
MCLGLPKIGPHAKIIVDLFGDLINSFVYLQRLSMLLIVNTMKLNTRAVSALHKKPAGNRLATIDKHLAGFFMPLIVAGKRSGALIGNFQGGHNE